MKYFLSAFFLMFLFSGCTTLINLWRYKLPDIADVYRMPRHELKKSTNPYVFPRKEVGNIPDPALWAVENIGYFPRKQPVVKRWDSPEDFLERSNTTALIVIQNDTIRYENYFNDFDQDMQSIVFSVSKSFASALAGIALEEGKFSSLDQPISDFIPEFKQGKKNEITINHLLQMTSGLDFYDYSTLYKLMELYYSNDQTTMIEKVPMRYEPGTVFKYKSYSTFLLGICIEKATGKPYYEYLQEKLWEPLGMEYDGYFTVDKERNQKAYGGIAACARDLAKFGTLYANKGKWRGEQILPEWWVERSSMRDTSEGSAWRYSNCFWLDTYPQEKAMTTKKDFFAGGYRGQAIYVNPELNIVIVRQGKSERGFRWGKSLSKLAMVWDAHQEIVSESQLQFVEGNYQGKNGKSLSVKFENNKLSIIGFNDCDDEQLKLTRISGASFSASSGKVKATLDYRNQNILGMAIEIPGQEYFFAKNDSVVQ
ncbi:MAG: serine hydrolase [Chitinophagales bacterium]